MFPALRQNGLARWLALLLALFGLAAGMLLCVALAEGGARGRGFGARAGEPGRTEALAVAREETPSSGVATTTSRRERSQAWPALGAGVRSATEALARTLESDAFEETAWRAAVDAKARELGAEALPELRAVLADDSRSPEEHVAASELVAALHAR